MKNSMNIFNMCDEPDYIKPNGPILPKFPVKSADDYDEFYKWKLKAGPDLDDDKAYLRFKCIKGFKKKFAHLSEDEKKSHWERIKYEISILEEKDFSSYMLIVSDYIKWAKSINMPCGPGRGSGAGSLVSYITDITTVDPIKHDLIFERFHNKEKKSFPDIDSDFADPSKVKEYLKNKYGEDKVASISNYNTLSPKVVIKDIARSLCLGGSKSEAFKIVLILFDTLMFPQSSKIGSILNPLVSKNPTFSGPYSIPFQALA
jgi:DNA polymerase-3 subunit alpha